MLGPGEARAGEAAAAPVSRHSFNTGALAPGPAAACAPEAFPAGLVQRAVTPGTLASNSSNPHSLQKQATRVSEEGKGSPLDPSAQSSDAGQAESSELGLGSFYTAICTFAENRCVEVVPAFLLRTVPSKPVHPMFWPLLWMKPSQASLAQVEGAHSTASSTWVRSSVLALFTHAHTTASSRRAHRGAHA